MRALPHVLSLAAAAESMARDGDARRSSSSPGSPPCCWPRVACTSACRRSVHGERHGRLPLNRYSKGIVLLMSEAVRFLHQFERIYGSGRCGDGLRLVGVGSGPSHPASVSKTAVPSDMMVRIDPSLVAREFSCFPSDPPAQCEQNVRGKSLKLCNSGP